MIPTTIPSFFMLIPSLYMLKMDNVSLKSPSPLRCHLIIASTFGQQKGPSQGRINGLEWATGARS
jgi:hypothetical protein